jgi:hypothetical protein
VPKTLWNQSNPRGIRVLNLYYSGYMENFKFFEKKCLQWEFCVKLEENETNERGIDN